MAAAIDRHLTAHVEQARLGADIDDAAGDETVFRGQGAGDQFDGSCEPRIERLAKDAQTFRKNDAVKTILKRIVFGTDVQLAELVLHDARRLQENLIELAVVAARHGRDRCFVDRVSRSAELRLDARAGFVEFAGGDDDRLRRVIGLSISRAGDKKNGAGGAGQEKRAQHCLESLRLPPGARLPSGKNREPDGIDVGMPHVSDQGPLTGALMTIDQAWGGARPRQPCDGARICGSAWSTTVMVETASDGGTRNCAAGVMNWPL